MTDHPTACAVCAEERITTLERVEFTPDPLGAGVAWLNLCPDCLTDGCSDEIIVCTTPPPPGYWADTR